MSYLSYLTIQQQPPAFFSSLSSFWFFNWVPLETWGFWTCLLSCKILKKIQLPEPSLIFVLEGVVRCPTCHTKGSWRILRCWFQALPILRRIWPRVPLLSLVPAQMLIVFGFDELFEPRFFEIGFVTKNIHQNFITSLLSNILNPSLEVLERFIV